MEEFLILEYGNFIVRFEVRVESNDRVLVGEVGIFGRDTIKYFI